MIAHDVTDRNNAQMILLALTERVAMRLRKLGYMASLVSISVKTDGLFGIATSCSCTIA